MAAANLGIHRYIMALLVGFSGIALILLAQWQMRESWRIGVDSRESTALITHGLYSRSRSPIYLGIFIYWLALIVIAPHSIILMLAMVCWFSIEVIARFVEEPHLKVVLGDEYTRYFERTNRYLVW